MSLWTARISRSETSICLSSPVLSCHVLSSITKSNILLLDLQCPPPLQATMTASNKVATFSNSKLTMQQCPCGLQEFPDLKLTFLCHVMSYLVMSCLILSCHVLYNKIKHFAPRSTMSPPLQATMTASNKVAAVSLWTVRISRSKTSICLSCRSPWCPLLQNQTLLQKIHVLLLDPQCPRPLQATMTTSNKVAALPNPKLAMQ